MIKKICFALMLIFLPFKGQAETLFADLSDHSITITPQFTGTQVLLFGSIQSKGDIIAVVRGPRDSRTVRKKDKVIGLWMNKDSVTFDEVPGFYRIFSSKPIDEIVTDNIRERYKIGHDKLKLDVASLSDPDINAQEFMQSLIQLKREAQLYSDVPRKIEFRGNNLFRTEISFPDNVPTGLYDVDIYFCQDGKILDAQTTPLVVQKVGLEAALFDLSRHYSWLYGLMAIVMALFFGWLSTYLFKKDR